YTLRLFNADDLVSAYVANSEHPDQLMLQARLGEDTGFVDISKFIRPGLNNITFTDFNAGGVWTYGFDLKADGVTIDAGVCGVVGVSGCRDNDMTVGLVFSQDPGVKPPAVPEPTTWALLVGGFGGAGAMLRRRRAAQAA
ncbi:PEPxxWA-CTERM sorting domain-containing protein, partial [Phenylobacterium sp.]|uniref:PEPxxWA-CTERM sorting domain-containing protein n=1 Tax=Phenylobacterium sp. TaxID=1871053 RepID=UPI0025E4ECAE